MRVLFYVGYPFTWAPGGHEIQIRETKRALEEKGVVVSWIHDDEEVPEADIIHYWTPPLGIHTLLAKAKGLKVVFSSNQGNLLASSTCGIILRSIRNLLLRIILTKQYYNSIGFSIYSMSDAFIFLTETEKNRVQKIFNIPTSKLYVIPNGISEEFLREGDKISIPFDGLISVGYISKVKNSVELALAAHRAKVPIKFVGGFRCETPDYEKSFRELIDNRFVYWEGEVKSKTLLAQHMRGAKGLILASEYEAYPLVIGEALACKIPVLARNLPNIREIYGTSISYCHSPKRSIFIKELTKFYEYALSNRLFQPEFKIIQWSDIAEKIISVYEHALSH